MLCAENIPTEFYSPSLPSSCSYSRVVSKAHRACCFPQTPRLTNAIVLLRFDDFYTPIAVELWSRRLIIVRTLVLDDLPLSKMLTQS